MNKNIDEIIIKGIPGKTPQKGVDYFDGKDGLDGKDGIDGKQGDKGEKGDKGDTGSPGKNGLNGKDGKKGLNGKDGKNGKDGSPDTPEQVKVKLLKVGLDYNELDNTPDINKAINIAVAGVRQSSKTYSLTELDDVNITDPTNAQALKWNSTTNKWENGTVSSGGGSETFETVSKNLKAYPYQISYSGGNIATITYDLGGGSEIIKTFGYTSGDVTSVTLSGNTPSGIDLVKTISYSGGNVAIISYL